MYVGVPFKARNTGHSGGLVYSVCSGKGYDSLSTKHFFWKETKMLEEGLHLGQGTYKQV